MGPHAAQAAPSREDVCFSRCSSVPRNRHPHFQSMYLAIHRRPGTVFRQARGRRTRLSELGIFADRFQCLVDRSKTVSSTTVGGSPSSYHQLSVR